jgi:hypothetical protein
MPDMKVSKEFLAEALKCATADELLAMCKEKGVALTREEAEKFLEQVKEKELSLDSIEDVEGGQTCIGAVSIPCVAVGV